MNKQEEIREGVKEVIKHALDYPLRKYGELFDDFYIDKLLSYLHSQGVVVKVKCPDCEWGQFGDEVVGMTPCYSCDSTGYIIKPLIEEESKFTPRDTSY